MLEILSGWNASFDKTSVGATVYNRWNIQFNRSLFHKYVSDDDQRMASCENYHWSDTLQRMISSVLTEKEESHFQTICEGAHPIYSGKNPCAFNIAMALIETKEFLNSKVSPNPSKWLWGDLHVNEYVNLPWSRTPLKPFFHKAVATPGNDNTPNVSKLSLRKNKDEVVMKSTSSANFKMLV
jgi:acyl-homoserine lactone acylase PvdQ